MGGWRPRWTRLTRGGRRSATRRRRGHHPLHFKRIADPGSCRKARVVPHNRRPEAGSTRHGSGVVLVWTSTYSVFDLPDLAAKADPRLIAGDEQHFAALAES